MTSADQLGEERAWALLRLLAHGARAAALPGGGFALGANDELLEVPLEQAWVARDAQGELVVGVAAKSDSVVAQMLDLYLPLCDRPAARVRVFAHIGQSLDGQIATQSGASRYVTGPENLRHMHRLRALCDGVIVGAGTVFHDDPRLTTRLVPGASPVRIVIDPSRRLPGERQVFRDKASRTLLVCAKGRGGGSQPGYETVEIEEHDGVLPPQAIVAALADRGLARLFVEGGGITVSRFLEARALERLHVTVCPLFIGKGRPGISLPPVDGLEQALRPKVRRFDLGQDVLFDCQWS